MLTHWRSITTRWGWVYLIASLAQLMPALFTGTYEKRELVRFGFTFLFALVWHVVRSIRIKNQRT
jgi:hypothetical protein